MRGRGWWREPIRHSAASRKGWKKRLGLRYFVKRHSPEEEKYDYQNVFRKKIVERRKQFKELDVPEFERYKDFKLPSKEKIEKMDIRYKKIEGLEPIEIPVRGGEKKIIGFHPTSRGAGGIYIGKSILIDPIFKDKTDWAIRKSTICHEFQHSVDLFDEARPGAVHNILRQVLLQNDPQSFIIGNFIELKKLAEKHKQKIKVRFTEQPNRELITVYYFKHSGKLYQFAKDSVFVSYKKLREICHEYDRNINTISIDGVKYNYVPFAFANIYARMKK